MGLIRHPGLQPLSRQHRDLLMQAHDLQDAAKDGGPHVPEAARRFLAFWARHGEAHFRYEENQLIACYATFCEVQSDPAVKTMLWQHTQIRRLIERVSEQLARHHDPTPLIAELGERLDAHIRHEERVVFPQIQERIPESELRSLPAPACPVPDGTADRPRT